MGLARQIKPKEPEKFEPVYDPRLGNQVINPAPADVMAMHNQQIRPATERKVGRPSSGKVRITLMVDPDVLERWRATGPGYQARIADLMKRYAP